jgi:hypothetical protein
MISIRHLSGIKGRNDTSRHKKEGRSTCARTIASRPTLAQLASQRQVVVSLLPHLAISVMNIHSLFLSIYHFSSAMEALWWILLLEVPEAFGSGQVCASSTWYTRPGSLDICCYRNRSWLLRVWLSLERTYEIDEVDLILQYFEQLRGTLGQPGSIGLPLTGIWESPGSPVWKSRSRRLVFYQIDSIIPLGLS